MKAARSAAKRAPTVADDSSSEHIYMGSDDLHPNPETTARTISSQIALNNAVRRARTELTFYQEGFLTVSEQRRGKKIASFQLDLHYLDPKPTLERVVAVRWLYATLGCGAVAGVAALLMSFEILRVAAGSVLIGAAVATLVVLFVAVYRSYERAEFYTIHGRVPVLRLVANLGSIDKLRAAVPALARAVEEAGDCIGDDTSAYLRAEMREHYRLRGAGVINTAACAEGTGRILTQFDSQV